MPDPPETRRAIHQAMQFAHWETARHNQQDRWSPILSDTECPTADETPLHNVGESLGFGPGGGGLIRSTPPGRACGASEGASCCPFSEPTEIFEISSRRLVFRLFLRLKYHNMGYTDLEASANNHVSCMDSHTPLGSCKWLH